MQTSSWSELAGVPVALLGLIGYAGILASLDTPVERARLARAIINLRDTKRLDSLLAAAAIIDLDSRSRILLNASLIQAAFIHTGLARTPGGLRLAA